MGMPNYVKLEVFTWDSIISPDYFNLTNKLGPHFRGLGITFMPFAYFRKKLPNKHFRDHFVCKYVD